MKSKKDEGIIKPQPIKGFDQRAVIYIPVDLPSLTIQKVLKKRAKKTKTTPLGQLYGFENRAVLSQCVGAPLAVLMLERLIISGAQEIIILGFCGALDEHTDIGEAVSVTEAASEEGTSKHYFPRKKLFRASSRLRARVENTLSEQRLSFVNGPVVSTDAPFRETRSWLDRNKARGIGFVDMETSAVFALADFYGIQAAALHLVSDQLTLSSHQMGLDSLKLARNTQKFFFPFIDPGM
ncbi:MAG TPA: nucleoside phosphorylase [Candidatus Heimdallarchaeota archaeon]|nr:nucleoside phosphorylase [Candidatus Heimdallarchaeota archaeon]